MIPCTSAVVRQVGLGWRLPPLGGGARPPPPGAAALGPSPLSVTAPFRSGTAKPCGGSAGMGESSRPPQALPWGQTTVKCPWPWPAGWAVTRLRAKIVEGYLRRHISKIDYPYWHRKTQVNLSQSGVPIRILMM
eukprot:COSAG01_NODE_5111_length_4474_cov_1.654936_4_plen_134_part_00